MKSIKNSLALAMALIMLISMFGCLASGNERYTVVTRLNKQQLCVAFRLDDKAGDAVIAALLALQDEGEVSRISRKWFNDDLSRLKGNSEALEELDAAIETRTFIVGYDAGHMPYSGVDGEGEPIGFDVELAQAVCAKLGWRIKFLAVDVANAEIELISGNVDCIWGGYALEETNNRLSYSPVYMENTVVIASLSASGIRSERSLTGRTLAVSETGQFSAALDTKPEVSERPEYLIRLPGGVDDCFKALDAGSCDAIVTDLAAIDFYR